MSLYNLQPTTGKNNNNDTPHVIVLLLLLLLTTTLTVLLSVLKSNSVANNSINCPHDLCTMHYYVLGANFVVLNRLLSIKIIL